MKIKSRPAFVRVFFLAFGFLATLTLSAASPAPVERETKPLEVTYYFLPG